MNRSIASLVILCSCLGCGDQPRIDTIASRDSAGIRILEVRSAEPVEGTIPLVGIPFTSPLPEFGDIVDVALAPGGRIIVLDLTEPHVVVLDSTGAELNRFGGAGDGPGEFRGSGLTDLVVLADGLAVPDAASQRVTLFGLDGTIRQTLPVPVNDGLALDWRGTDGNRMIVRRLSQPQRLEVLDPSSSTFEALADLAVLAVPSQVGPLQALPVWCRLADGRLVVGRTDEYSLRLLEDGVTTSILRGDIEARPMADSDVRHVEDLLQQSLSRRFGGSIDPEFVRRLLAANPVPDMAPRLAGLICAGTEVWVQRALPVSGMGVHVLRVGTTGGWGSGTWDVFDLDAGTVARIELPAGTQLTRITDRMIAGFSTDELGRETPARWARE